MKAIAVVVALTLGFLLLGQVGGKSPAPTMPRFRLDVKSDIKQGAIRAYAESVYSFYETRSNGVEVERWRITQQDKYAYHWISPSGTVWVKTDSMPGPGGGGHIWARDANADLKGLFPIGGEIDLAASHASVLGPAEQLALQRKDGSRTTVKLIDTNQGSVSVVRELKPGETDQLGQLLQDANPSNPPELVRYPGTSLCLWKVYGPGQPRLIRQTLAWSSFPAVLNVKGEEPAEFEPTLVERTPTNKIVWFEFARYPNQGAANLRIFNPKGEQLKVIDLRELGEFPTSDEAHRSIIYGDVRWNGGFGDMPLSVQDRYSVKDSETLSFADRRGRKYRVSITESGHVEAIASFNLGAPPKKEPTFPSATQARTLSGTSADGKFSAVAKIYSDSGKKQGQLTLTAHITDPVEGAKSVEMFSMPVSGDLETVKVSNSGRVFGVSFISGQPVGDKKVDLCLVHMWDPNGRNLSMDLIRLKWFANLAEARSQLDLKRFTAEPEGIRGERKIEGVPIPVYPLEKLTFPFRSGKTENLFVGNINDQLPSMFYYKRPGSMPKLR